jgi:hypothetical protein
MVSEQVTGEVGELGVEGVLDAVESWHAERSECDTRIFVAAAHFADLHCPDSRPHRGGRILPGMERPVRLGGVGTPRVWEFAVAEFGARLGRSPRAGRALIADALDTRHRLPRLWARVCAGEVPISYARHVAQQTRELSADAAGLVDAEVAGAADGRLSWSRFETLVAGKVAAADPERAAERERAAAEEEFARLGRSNEHGQKTLYVRSNAAAMIRVDATIAYYATVLAVLGDTDPEDKRRAKALLILANPTAAVQLLQAFAQHRTERNARSSSDSEAAGSEGTGSGEGEPDTLDGLDDSDESGKATGGAQGDDPAAFLRPFRPHEIHPDTRFAFGFDPRTLLPAVTVYLHLYARTDTGHIGPVARWEGEGPVTTAYLRDLLGPAATFTIKPVIDLPGMAPVDGYEIPDRHREAVHLRTPADAFPFAANTTRAKQHDHTRPYLPPDHGGPPGQTGLHNLGPLTQFHHRIKTHGTWTVKQPFPGIYLWRDPHGRTYLVDHTGTRPVGKTGPPTPTADLAIDVFPEPDVDIYYEPHHAA